MNRIPYSPGYIGRWIDSSSATDVLSRRGFLRGGAAAAVVSLSALKGWELQSPENVTAGGAAQLVLPLDSGWLFGGKLTTGALEAAFADGRFVRVTLPHCVTPLGWRNWDPAAWEDVWIYRRHFALPHGFSGMRLFLQFDRVMEGASPVVNGHALPGRVGGFLPFEYEITGKVQSGENVLAVAVDSRWLNAPPSGSSRGPRSVDYLLAGGITGGVKLRVVPPVFIQNVFAKAVNVLDAGRRLELRCSVDAAAELPAKIRLEAALSSGERVVARTTTEATIEKAQQDVELVLERLGNIELWDTENPRLYDVEVTLFETERAVHTYRTRVGFRDARFELQGFYLNGQRLQIFGLNRHELFPYTGFAMPDRVLRRDAEVLRRQLNCNMVRCSHYPQSEAFLNACDELGLMVWEETPGWQYLGDATFKELVVRDVEEMVKRDRNHPAIVIWGVRVNESPNDPELYRKTREVAYAQDGTRQTSGTMTPDSRKTWQKEWHQDVFAFDDYHSAPDGSVGIDPPVEGYPYLISEAVGQFNYGGKGFGRKYRRAEDAGIQERQGLLHAQAHSKAAANKRICGVIGWCAFDYPSLMNAWDAVKCPGVADVFRIPKLGAGFYMSQCDPAVRPVIEPDFYWDFGEQTPAGPGNHAAIFSNCEELEVYLDGKLRARLDPDRAGFDGIQYPPFFADLTLKGAARPELRIDGFVSRRVVVSRRFSADRAADRLWLRADDDELMGDGSDATRLAFGVEDKFGALRAFAGGEVALKLSGPAEIVGQNPFSIVDSGGAGAVWVKTLPNRTGLIRIEARHASLESKRIEIRVVNAAMA
ncbi:MAG TPA: glycoside hydrolase family 2 TIM barrel-domain containing protein [Terracidiphilus sp.]|nr:glycoside hydrolase family 2 TIM barrel-domain containing protein [Terracidiphilus sp.]